MYSKPHKADIFTANADKRQYNNSVNFMVNVHKQAKNNQLLHIYAILTENVVQSVLHFEYSFEAMI